MKRQEQNAGQQLYMAVNTIWEAYYDEVPVVDEERIWQVVASILETKEALVLELRFGRRLGYNLTLNAVGAVLKREKDNRIGVTGARARDIQVKSLRKLRKPTYFILLQETLSMDSRKKSEGIMEIGNGGLSEREFRN